MFPNATAIILGIALAGFLFSAYNRFILLKTKASAHRTDKLLARFWKVLVYAVGQKRFFLHGRASGIMHAFIFWGFCTVGLRSMPISCLKTSFRFLLSSAVPACYSEEFF
ncbi:MAG: hypothetical protein HYU98_04480 [Deltaproteobacteria bacterium]|nr:hypothetical protein [Deltaproteobacteria bacterium]